MKLAVKELFQIRAELAHESEEFTKRVLPILVRAGKIYTQMKEQLDHGEWIPWIEKNSPFSRYTVARYMRIYENREKLKCASVTHFTEALALISDGKKKDSKNESDSYLKKAKALPKAQEESEESAEEEQEESSPEEQESARSEEEIKEGIRMAIDELSKLWWTQNSKGGYHDFTRIALTKYLVQSI